MTTTARRRRDRSLPRGTSSALRGATGAEPAWLRALRAAAFERFADARLPDHARRGLALHERRARSRRPRSRRPTRRTVPAERLRRLDFGGAFDRLRARVRQRPLRAGALVGLDAAAGVAVREPARGARRRTATRLRAHLARRRAAGRADPFRALNTALFEDGAFVARRRGVRARRSRSTSSSLDRRRGAPPTVAPAHPRRRRARQPGDASSRRYAGADGRRLLHERGHRDRRSARARVVDHYKLQRESAGRLPRRDARGRARRATATFTRHSMRARRRARAQRRRRRASRARAPSARSTASSSATARSTVDNHTLIDHAAPHCTSRELYKGILDGRARGVFNGKILVRAGRAEDRRPADEPEPAALATTRSVNSEARSSRSSPTT